MSLSDPTRSSPFQGILVHFGTIDLLNKCKSGIFRTRRLFFETQVISLINARAVFLEPADLQLHFIYYVPKCTHPKAHHPELDAVRATETRCSCGGPCTLFRNWSLMYFSCSRLSTCSFRFSADSFRFRFSSDLLRFGSGSCPAHFRFISL